jgi:4-hydroxy-tetrahydrodipicolinate reductase
MRVLLLGHGRMGRLVESLAPSYGATIVGVIDEHSGDGAIAAGQFADVDVAIDFTLADAVPKNLPRLAERRISVVIGTTGWQAQESSMRAIAAKAGIGVLAASNFSLGMNVFQLAVEEASRHFAGHAEFGAWIHEAHHVMKKDAPSGTALTIKSGMEGTGYARSIDVSSTRVGSVPGTHTVGFDGPSETIEFTHTVRDRAVFARGALVAAKWLIGKQGWFSIRDLLAAGRQPQAEG